MRDLVFKPLYDTDFDLELLCFCHPAKRKNFGWPAPGPEPRLRQSRHCGQPEDRLSAKSRMPLAKCLP